jgi:hypothetical protein
MQVFAVGKCNHRNICARCNLKQRLFFKDLACLMCKAQLPTVVYTSHPSRSFEAFGEREVVSSARLGGCSTHEPSTRAMLERLLDCVCPLCGPVTGLFSDRDALASHVTRQHGLHYCPVCLRDRPVFISEQICFSSKSEMTAHMNKGDEKTHMKGHPKCHFCNEHFYGDEQLYDHMKQLHMECPVCRGRGILHQFYRAYRDLRKHWSDSPADHFVCPDAANCEMVVFGTDVEWRQHQLNVHGSALSKQEARRLLNVTDVFEIRLANDRRATERSNRVGFQTAETEAADAAAAAAASASAAASSAGSSVSSSASSGSLIQVLQALPQPPASEMEARARNAEVMARMREILHEDVFVHFRENAQRFREGQTSPQDYFDSFVGIFGEEETATLFPKVVSLLPAAEKRAVLFDIYSRFFVAKKSSPPAAAADAKKKNNKARQGKDKKADKKADRKPPSAPDAAKTKKCSVCLKDKAVSDFSKNQAKRGGTELRCRSCVENAANSASTGSIAAGPVVPAQHFPALGSAGVAVVAPPPGFDGPPPGFEQQFPALPERAERAEEEKQIVAPAPAPSVGGGGGGKKKKQQQKMVLLKFG